MWKIALRKNLIPFGPIVDFCCPVVVSATQTLYGRDETVSGRKIKTYSKSYKTACNRVDVAFSATSWIFSQGGTKVSGLGSVTVNLHNVNSVLGPKTGRPERLEKETLRDPTVDVGRLRREKILRDGKQIDHWKSQKITTELILGTVVA